MRRPAMIGVLVALAVCAAAAQQPPNAPLVFRAEVNYVEVDATVTNAQGEPVSDLTQGEFDILEDGKAQTVASFARVDLPVRHAERPLFAGQAIEPDVRTNAAIEGHIYLIVLDDLHTDFARTQRVKANARRFIEQAVGATDVAAIVYTGRNDASQDFTSSQRLLLGAVDKFIGGKVHSAELEKLDNAVVNASGNITLGPDTYEAERAYRARSVMGSIRKLCEFMAGVHGRRKAMLWFGEGIDYDVDKAMGPGATTSSSTNGFNGQQTIASSIVLEDIRNAIAAAQRGNVAVYTIDPRGLFDASADLVETPGLTDEADHLPSREIQNEVRVSQESLRQVAVDTGGFSVLNTNDFARAFDRIVSENSSYYLLGYYPTNDKRDGKTRTLQVRVKRPGLTVRARKSYVAAKGKTPAPAAPAANAPPPAVVDALGSPLPVPGMPMRAFAAAFKGPAQKANVAFAIEMDASPLNFVNRAGAWVESLEVVNTAVAAGGTTIPGDRAKIALTLKPATYDLVQASGLRVLGQMELPPGRYQLRLAAGTGAGKAGSVIYDLDVPDFSKPPLSMSGVALTSVVASQVTTLRPKDPLKDYLPGPPVATRDFSRGDTLTAFAEIYDNQRGGAAHQVAITGTLISDAGAVVRTISEERSSRELEGKAGGYGFTATLPLADIAPGLYVIRVQARGNFEGLPTVAHDIQIRVVP
jgi:VWFA-related protein